MGIPVDLAYFVFRRLCIVLVEHVLYHVGQLVDILDHLGRHMDQLRFRQSFQNFPDRRKSMENI